MCVKGAGSTEKTHTVMIILISILEVKKQTRRHPGVTPFAFHPACICSRAGAFPMYTVAFELCISISFLPFPLFLIVSDSTSQQSSDHTIATDLFSVLLLTVALLFRGLVRGFTALTDHCQMPEGTQPECYSHSLCTSACVKQQ